MARHLARALCLILLGACAEEPPGVDGSVPMDAGADAARAEDASVDALRRDAPTSADSATDSATDSGTLDFEHDLDGDGSPDTNLRVDTCATGLCVLVESRVTMSTEVALPAESRVDGGTIVRGETIALIGDHTGDGLHEVSVLHYLQREGYESPALSVVDVGAATILGHANAPAGLSRFEQYDLAAYSDSLRDPEGLRYPFLLPSFGDAPGLPWGYGCLFRPGMTGDARCGPGFQSVDTVPEGAGNWFREVGAYTQDLDGDGWEDMHLIFHRLVFSVSGRTGAHIGTTIYDVAAAESQSPAWFHSGRNYGTHAAFTGADGTLQTLIVGGAPVGTFGDLGCNVSRFVANLSTTPGAPATRRLAWAAYFGFASTSFSVFDAMYVGRAADAVSRLGDFADGCIHRFGDSRTVIDGEEAVIFNYFDADGPVDACLEEQYRLYIDPVTNWMDEKSETWYACLAQNVGSLGTWGMQARRIVDGSSITGSQGTYIWGRADSVLDGAEALYFVETLPTHARFDLEGLPNGAMSILALVDGLWVTRGTLPVSIRPALRQVAPQGSRGVGSFTNLFELDLTDRDGDGQDEIRLESGEWVGANNTGAFVVKD